MIDSGDAGQPAFSVDLTGAARAQFRDIARHALYHRRGEIVAAAMGLLLDELEQRPRVYGEPLYELRKIRMQVRAAAMAPLRIEYGVHYDHPVVVIRSVMSLKAKNEWSED